MPKTPRKKKQDDDSPEFTAEMFKRAKRMHELPAELQAVLMKHEEARKQRALAKVAVTITLSSDVVTTLRAGGPDWQGRVDDILRKAIIKPVRKKAA